MIQGRRTDGAVIDPAASTTGTLSGREPVSRPRTLRLVNLGCGNHFHPEWTNLDLRPQDPRVSPWDVKSGLPFPDGSLDAVYHSHLLEHLDVEDGAQLVRECYRVLRPGGILRVVVPDLEQIARLYLELLEKAWQGEEAASGRFEWIKLELLDQMVRSQSGGRMGPFMASLDDSRAEFVRARVGVEYHNCRKTTAELQLSRSGTGGDGERQALSAAGDFTVGTPVPVRKGKQNSAGWRARLARLLVRWLAGESVARNFDEARFRAAGEIHRWMYDRMSLRIVCQSAGFAGFRICTAAESSIPEFRRYGLDERDGVVRKPDSLFVECHRPAA